MKKLLVIAAAALAASPAMASKARVAALGNSAHVVDQQSVFTNPAYLLSYGNFVTFEMGETALTATTVTDTNTNAEGGFSRVMADARFGAYLGHTNVTNTNRKDSDTDLLSEENPINLYYARKIADWNMGFGLNYSSSDKKTTEKKQSSMGLSYGLYNGNVDAYINIGLTDKSDNTSAEAFKGDSSVDAWVGYTMNEWYFYGNYANNGGKCDGCDVNKKVSDATTKVGFVNTVKGEGSDFFFGAAYSMNTNKKTSAANAETKVESTTMPFIVGVEAEAASWLVLRGSVTQNVLISSTKTNGGKADTVANNTTFAGGAGIKFNKFTLDGTLKGSTDGEINGDKLLASAGLTYAW